MPIGTRQITNITPVPSTTISEHQATVASPHHLPSKLQDPLLPPRPTPQESQSIVLTPFAILESSSRHHGQQGRHSPRPTTTTSHHRPVPHDQGSIPRLQKSPARRHRVKKSVRFAIDLEVNGIIPNTGHIRSRASQQRGERGSGDSKGDKEGAGQECHSYTSGTESYSIKVLAPYTEVQVQWLLINCIKSTTDWRSVTLRFNQEFQDTRSQSSLRRRWRAAVSIRSMKALEQLPNLDSVAADQVVEGLLKRMRATPPPISEPFTETEMEWISDMLSNAPKSKKGVWRKINLGFERRFGAERAIRPLKLRWEAAIAGGGKKE